MFIDIVLVHRNISGGWWGFRRFRGVLAAAELPKAGVGGEGEDVGGGFSRIWQGEFNCSWTLIILK